jgi:hypothetical protein
MGRARGETSGVGIAFMRKTGCDARATRAQRRMAPFNADDAGQLPCALGGLHRNEGPPVAEAR